MQQRRFTRDDIQITTTVRAFLRVRDGALVCPYSKHAQANMENVIYLHTAQLQYTESEIRALEYSSEPAKEFFSFHKLLGLRGLLKIFFWSLSSPWQVFQFILPLMVWNWVLLGLGTWSLLPGAQRQQGKASDEDT